MNIHTVVSSSSISNPDQGGYYQGTYQYFEPHSSPGDSESTVMIGSSPSSGLTSPKSFDSFSPNSSFVSPPPGQVPPSQHIHQPQQQRVFNFESDLVNIGNEPNRFSGPSTANGSHAPVGTGNYGNGFGHHQHHHFPHPHLSGTLPPPPVPPPPVPPPPHLDYSKFTFDGAKLQNPDGLLDAANPAFWRDAQSNAFSANGTRRHLSEGSFGYATQPHFSTAKHSDTNPSSHFHLSQQTHTQQWNTSGGHPHLAWIDRPSCLQSQPNSNNHREFRPKNIPPFSFNRQRQSEIMSQTQLRNEYYRGKSFSDYTYADQFMKSRYPQNQQLYHWNRFPPRQAQNFQTNSPRYTIGYVADHSYLRII